MRVAKFPIVSKVFTPIHSLPVLKTIIITGIYSRSLLGFIFAKVNP
jgi:hypothetical protein